MTYPVLADPPPVWGIDTATITTKYAPQLAAYSFDADPAKRVRFAIRYYRPGPVTNPHGVQPDEAAALWNNGLWLGAVFQGGHASQQPGYFSADQGRRDAEAALRKADQLQQPDQTTVFFAVDTDILPATIESVVGYFSAARAKLASQRPALWVGCYGDDLVCRRLHADGLVDVTWLANARGWRDDKSFPGWHVRQGRETTLPFGLVVDPNEARDLRACGFWGPA